MNNAVQKIRAERGRSVPRVGKVLTPASRDFPSYFPGSVFPQSLIGSDVVNFDSSVIFTVCDVNVTSKIRRCVEFASVHGEQFLLCFKSTSFGIWNQTNRCTILFFIDLKDTENTYGVQFSSFS